MTGEHTPVAAADPLRPERLGDFAGQPRVTRQLQLILDGARRRGELTDHVLLSGPPGLGKTTLAYIVGAELGVGVRVTTGPALEKPRDLAELLVSLPAASVVFIDEIHALPRPVEEVLYPAMEDSALDLRAGEGSSARTYRVPVPAFTLVAATTQQGLLSAPLQDRFGYVGRLEPYDDDALAGIISRSAGLLGVEVDDDAAAMLARRSRGTPRIANRLLRRCRDVAETRGGRVDVAVVEETLDAFEVDALGLDRVGRHVLEALCVSFRGGPVGLSTLAARVDETPTTVQEVHEPFLLRRGLIAITPRGRVATAAAYEHLGLPVPSDLVGPAAGGAGEAQAALPLDDARAS